VGIEYIAQTVAALVGLQALREDGRVRVGYLLGTRRYHASRPWFPIGERLTVRVAGEFESMGLARYQGEIRDASGEQIVTCSVTLYAGSNEEERE
jgi:predicted hotdog family 3-hydroxylacyl-ACP dehydratase